MKYFIEYKTKFGAIQKVGDYTDILIILKDGYTITKLIPLEVRQ